MDDFVFLTPQNDKENKSTPKRTNKKQCLQLTPILNTPNGSKVSHPFIKNLITNRYNSQINDDFFEEKERTPNIGFYSPDFSGTLFPKEINTSHVQLKCFETLYKKYRDYCNVKSSQILIDESIAPSPDSGVGSSIHTTISSLSEMSKFSNSLFHVNTPPSHFKWNRKEYRSDFSNESVEDLSTNNDDDDEYIPNWNFESTQIFDNEFRLADNISMRRHSVIKSTNPFNRDESNIEISESKRGKKRKLDADSSISSILRDSALDDIDLVSDVQKKPPLKLSFNDSNTDFGFLNAPQSNRSSPNNQWSFDCDLSFNPIHFDIGDNPPDLPDIDLSPIKAYSDNDSV